MKKTLTKIDAKYCKAEIAIVPVFLNNDSNNYFAGKVVYFERGQRLFTESCPTVRISKLDAFNDALDMARENNFAEQK